MKTSVKGIDFIKSYEAFRGFAYPDPGSELAKAYPSRHWGFRSARSIFAVLPAAASSLSAAPWTVGYGFTAEVTKDSTMTKEEANNRFISEIVPYELAVTKLTEGRTTQAEFDAMVSFTYNIGIKAFSKSSVLKAHLRRDYAAASRAFGLWNKAKGKVLEGLTKRRAAEANRYLSNEIGIPEDLTPASVDPESTLVKSPIVASSTIAAATGTLALLAEHSASVKVIKDNLGDSFPYVAAAIIVAAAIYTIYVRYTQRTEGWA